MLFHRAKTTNGGPHCTYRLLPLSGNQDACTYWPMWSRKEDPDFILKALQQWIHRHASTVYTLAAEGSLFFSCIHSIQEDNMQHSNSGVGSAQSKKSCLTWQNTQNCAMRDQFKKFLTALRMDGWWHYPSSNTSIKQSKCKESHARSCFHSGWPDALGKQESSYCPLAPATAIQHHIRSSTYFAIIGYLIAKCWSYKHSLFIFLKFLSCLPPNGTQGSQINNTQKLCLVGKHQFSSTLIGQFTSLETLFFPTARVELAGAKLSGPCTRAHSYLKFHAKSQHLEDSTIRSSFYQ